MALKDNNMEFFTKQLMEWNRRFNRREMPWKNEKDPYKIWLSEIILQQTRVEQGWAYYEKILKKYPTLAALAAAKETTLFKLWEGLGYYSRCRNLLFTARYIKHAYNGLFPKTYEQVLALKGIGPYTAAAIVSFAYNEPFAVVDGNVMRVIARFMGEQTPIDTNEGKKLFQQLADRLLDKQYPGKYNQAIMDFGATVCKPQLPLCADCPMANKCKAHSKGQVGTLPVKSKAIAVKERYIIYLIVKTPDGYYIRTRATGDIWAQLNEFISLETEKKETPQQIIHSKVIASILPGEYKLIAYSDWQQQKLTHRTVHVLFMQVEIKKPYVIPTYTLKSKKQIARLAFPKIIQHYIKNIEW